MRKMIPMVAGAMPNTSVENFIRYMVVRKNMNPTPPWGAAQIRMVERGRRSSALDSAPESRAASVVDDKGFLFPP
jgi:hypothetical protein